MAITYAELTDEVVENLEIDNDSTSLTRFKVVASINSAQKTLLNILPVEYLKNAVRTSTFDLEEDTADYQWPSDFVRVVQMWLNYSAAITYENEGKEAALYVPNKFMEPITNLAKEFMPMYDINIEGGFRIAPLPTTDMVNGGMLRYIWQVPDISTTQDSMFEEELKNLLVFRATALSANVENYNPKLAADYKDYYDKELAGFLPKENKK